MEDDGDIVTPPVKPIGKQKKQVSISEEPRLLQPAPS